MGCINCALAALAATLALVALCLLAFETVPIPEWIVRQLEARIEEASADFRFEWSSLSSTLAGEVVLKDVVIRERRSDRVALRCGKIIADFGFLMRLRGGPLPLDILQVENAVLYAPPEISPETDHPLAQVIALRLGLTSSAFSIEQLLISVDGVGISVEGTLPAPVAMQPDEEELDGNLRLRWAEISRLITAARSHLNRAPEARFSMTLAGDDAGSVWLSANLTAPTLELPGGIRVEALYAQLSKVAISSKAILTPLSFEADRIVRLGPDDPANAPSLRNVRAWLRGPTSDVGGWSLPGELDVFAQVEAERLPPTTAYARIPLLPLREKPSGWGRAQSSSLATAWSGVLDPEKETIDLEFGLWGDPDRFLAHPGLGTEGVGRFVRFSDAVKVEGAARWIDPEGFDRADFTISARDFQTRETAYDEAHARIHLTSERLIANPIEVFDPGGQHAVGMYIHHFADQRFRILGRGEIFPRRLDSLLPRFYRELWERIDPGKTPAAGDVDVRGVWGDGARTQTFLAVSGNDVSYKSQPVDVFSLRLRQSKGFVELINLQAATSDGQIGGDLAFLFPEDDAQPFRTLLDLDAHLPLEALAKILGNEAETIQRFLSTSDSPFLHLKGQFSSYPDGRTDKDLRVDAATRHPLSFAGMRFDWLRSTAHVTNGGFSLSPLTFGFAGGSGQADVSVETPADRPSTIHLTAHLNDANYITADQLLRRFLNGTPDETARTAVAPEESGVLNLFVETRGELGRWDQYTGRGRLDIQKAPLGQIELFGGLSRLFGSIGLNLATFQLQDLKSDLVLAPGLIGFPNLNIRGPSLNIESQGQVAVPSADLDFDAKVFFLESEDPSIRSLFGALLRPFGHAFEVTVEGSPRDPQWSFKRNPLNLLRPVEERPSISEPEIRTPAEAP